MILRIFKKPEQPKPAEFQPMFPSWRRSCLVDGDQAYFHRWAEQSVVFKDWENKTHVVRHTYALIEYIDGTVELTQPERLRFTDH